MPRTSARKFGIVVEIWRSFTALPTWVRLWVAVILVPVNLISVAFLAQPSGVLIAVLACGGLVLGTIAVLYSRGFSRVISWGHLLCWTPLVLMLILARPDATGAYDSFLTVLLVTNLISLAFDFNDLRLWIGGDRAVAQPPEQRP